MKRTIIVAAALLVGLSVPVVAQAAPSMSIDKVLAGTSVSGPNDAPTVPPTTWHVGLSRIGAWNSSACSSTAFYTDSSFGDTRADGKDAAPNGPWNSWSFTAKTPGSWTFVPNPDTGDTGDGPGGLDVFELFPLARISATCDLTRRVYLGRHYYRRGITFTRTAPATSSRRHNGCKSYSYETGSLTIDCRHSGGSGSATWAFRVRPTDRGGTSMVYFDRSLSTIGAHPVTVSRFGNRMYVTETVSPGTMITVTSVEASVSRLYSRKVYRHDSKTLTANWSS